MITSVEFYLILIICNTYVLYINTYYILIYIYIYIHTHKHTYEEGDWKVTPYFKILIHFLTRIFTRNQTISILK